MSSLEALRIGTFAFGGGYGTMDRNRVVESIRAALDLGITAFDTSPMYGDGAADRLLAEALGADVRTCAISTKVRIGSAVSPNDIRTSIYRDLHGTLDRLGRDKVDICYLADATPSRNLEDAMVTMLALKEIGMIGSIGLCVDSIHPLQNALVLGSVNCIQTTYNLLSRPADPDLFPLCGSAKIAVHACEPFCRGLLLGFMRKNVAFEEGDARIEDRRFRGDRFRSNLDLVGRIRMFAAQEGLSLLQLAIGWVLQHPSVDSAVCGVRSAGQVRQLVAAADTRLTLDQILELDLIIGDDKYQRPQ
jgi:aryl-alcohol dehydrogenase-like predicted oxidoreductase